jgi:hypothetical protein
MRLILDPILDRWCKSRRANNSNQNDKEILALFIYSSVNRIFADCVLSMIHSGLAHAWFLKQSRFLWNYKNRAMSLLSMLLHTIIVDVNTSRTFCFGLCSLVRAHRVDDSQRGAGVQCCVSWNGRKEQSMLRNDFNHSVNDTSSFERVDSFVREGSIGRDADHTLYRDFVDTCPMQEFFGQFHFTMQYFVSREKSEDARLTVTSPFRHTMEQRDQAKSLASLFAPLKCNTTAVMSCQRY